MRKICSFVVLAGVLATPASACDLCSVYSAAQAHGGIGKGFVAGAAEQFTYFGTLQDNDAVVSNPADQYLASSISQIFAGYNFTERVGVQFTLPVIYRSYQRPDGFDIERGNVSGPGDASLIGHGELVRLEKMNSTFTWNVLGGVKFPTGSTSLLQEEVDELTEPPPPPGAPENAIHGHDLTLGSGSYDGIVGTAIYGRWRRVYLSAGLQYAIRTTGAYDYRFANDLTWAGGPGFYLVLTDSHTLALQLNVSGETKGLDTLQGAPVDDTGITTVYLGPQINFSWSDKLSAEAGVDFPVSIANTALQIVPNYRVNAAFVWHF